MKNLISIFAFSLILFVSCKKDSLIAPIAKQAMQTTTTHTVELKTYLIDVDNLPQFSDWFKSNIYLCTNVDTVDISTPGQVGNSFRSTYTYTPTSFDSLVNIGFDTLADHVFQTSIATNPIPSKVLTYTLSNASPTYLELHDRVGSTDRLILKIPLNSSGLTGNPIYSDGSTHAVFKPPYANIFELFAVK